jgi:(R,R)-butanediol dehydrogenase/meso-butanediol dehydrogenase/diacetyl reductase
MVIKVRHCGICGSDLHASEEGTAQPVPVGTVMGHEFCGEIVRLGPGAEARWKEGDRITALPFIGCGTCALCLTGQANWCRKIRGTGFGRIPGGYAEYALVGMNESVRLPDSVSWTEGALVEPLAVGLHGVQLAQLPPGSDILVVGAGPVGLATVIWARLLGARHIVVTARSSRRADLARALGATEFVESDQDLRAAFRKVAGGPPAAIFECVGAPGMIDLCCRVAPVRSKVVVLGVCMKPDTFLPSIAVQKELNLQFSMAYGTRDFEIAVDMLARGRIDPEDMVTDVVGFDAFPGAFEALRHRSHQCKVLLQPT